MLDCAFTDGVYGVVEIGEEITEQRPSGSSSTVAWTSTPSWSMAIEF